MEYNRYLSSSSAPHLDQMQQFGESWISTAFEAAEITMRPEINIQQNQLIENNHCFSLSSDCNFSSSSSPPSPPHLDQNPDLAMPSNQMTQFDEPWISAAFEAAAITMPPEMNIQRDQSIENNQGFSLPGKSKTEAEIALDNYLKIYSAVDDPLS